MLDYAKIQDKTGLLYDLTGLTPQAFAQLLSSFHLAYERYLDQRDAQRERPRRRRRGGGRKAILATEADKLIYILFYFKFYPTQEVLSSFFGFGQSQASEWVRRLTPILNAALGYERQLPARQATSAEQILAACPGLALIVSDVKHPMSYPRRERWQRDDHDEKKHYVIQDIVVTNRQVERVQSLGGST